MTDGEQRVFVSDVSAEASDPYAVGRLHTLRHERVGGRELWAGLWRVDPGDLPPGTLHESEHDETFHILAGRVRLEIEDGPTLELGAGAIGSLRRGTRARWTILEPLEEFFVYT